MCDPAPFVRLPFAFTAAASSAGGAPGDPGRVGAG